MPQDLVSLFIYFNFRRWALLFLEWLSMVAFLRKLSSDLFFFLCFWMITKLMLLTLDSERAATDSKDSKCSCACQQSSCWVWLGKKSSIWSLIVHMYLCVYIYFFILMCMYLYVGSFWKQRTKLRNTPLVRSQRVLLFKKYFHFEIFVM